MREELDPLTTEREFFTALVEASVEDLDRVLAHDFILIEVMGGSEITKSSLLAALDQVSSSSKPLTLPTPACEFITARR
jgi:hypothetical protein